jgi:hypothetical protein
MRQRLQPLALARREPGSLASVALGLPHPFDAASPPSYPASAPPLAAPPTPTGAPAAAPSPAGRRAHAAGENRRRRPIAPILPRNEVADKAGTLQRRMHRTSAEGRGRTWRACSPDIRGRTRTNAEGIRSGHPRKDADERGGVRTGHPRKDADERGGHAVRTSAEGGGRTRRTCGHVREHAARLRDGAGFIRAPSAFLRVLPRMFVSTLRD